ncbi:MAG: HEAT repeat domain-containing protein [Anaerolineales bacterium]|nr:HEAT repeat domain-containing protein [Anaerolineales bacterium]
MLRHSVDTVTPAENPSRVLSRALARVWANLSLSDDVRVEAALGLIAAKAWPAFDICMRTLPLSDDPNHRQPALLQRLLPALASPRAVPWLWALVDRAARPAQRALLIHCLGRARGIALDDRFEQLLANSSEAVAAAAVGALAESLGPPSADRLAQIAATDGRADVTLAALEGLAIIGSEQALPYLREKLQAPVWHGDAVFQLAQFRHIVAERLLAELALAARNDLAALYRLYLPALAISGGAAAVQAIYDILGLKPDDLLLSQVRGQLSPDTAVRAQTEWSSLAGDPSPTWRMAATAVLAQDASQVLLDRVVRMAIDDDDWTERDFARRALRWGAPAIASEPIADFVLAHLERQVARLGRPDAFLLELMAQCLNGLAHHKQVLPSDVARRALAILRYLLPLTHPTDEGFTPLQAALALPEFAEAAGDLERLPGEAPDADSQGQILDTLVAMRPPKLLDVLIRLVRSSRGLALRARIESHIVAFANDGRLMRLPNDLNHVAYEAAIVRNIRFQRKGIRQAVILANGAS